MVEVEMAGADVILRQDLNERNVVEEQTLRQVASRRRFCAFSYTPPLLLLGASDPILALTAEVCEQPAAVQDCSALSVKTLICPRADRLDSVCAVLQAERGA